MHPPCPSARALPLALREDAATIVSGIAACSALSIKNLCPTTAFALSRDDASACRDEKWNGSFFESLPFFLPACLGLAVAVPFGLMAARFVIG